MRVVRLSTPCGFLLRRCWMMLPGIHTLQQMACTLKYVTLGCRLTAQHHTNTNDVLCEAWISAWIYRLKQSLDCLPSSRTIRTIQITWSYSCAQASSAMLRALELLGSHAAVVEHIRELKLNYYGADPLPDHLVATSLQQFTALERLKMHLEITGAANAELLWQALLRCTQLTYLALQLDHFSPQANPRPLQLLMARLHKLRLTTTDQSPKDLAAALRHCTQLRKLHWSNEPDDDMPWIPREDSEYEELWDVLEGLPLLEDLCAAMPCSLACLARCHVLRKVLVSSLLIRPSDLEALAQEQLCSETLEYLHATGSLVCEAPEPGCLARILPRLEHFEICPGMEEAVECLRGHQRLRCFKAWYHGTGHDGDRCRSWDSWVALLRGVASWPLASHVLLPLPATLTVGPQLGGRGMEELADAAACGSLRQFHVYHPAARGDMRRTRLGLADVICVLGPEGLLGLRQASSLLAVGQDVCDLEWGLGQLLGAGGGGQQAGGGDAELRCMLLAHVGRMLAAQQLLLAIQQRLELDLAAAEADAEACDDDGSSSGGGGGGSAVQPDDGNAEEGPDAGGSAGSPRQPPGHGSDDADGAAGSFYTLPSMWPSGCNPQQAVGSMVQQVAEALPHAGAVLGAGWQQGLAEALLLRWQVLVQLRQLCPSRTPPLYDDDGVYIGSKRCDEFPGGCDCMVYALVEYGGCTVTLAGLNH